MNPEPRQFKINPEKTQAEKDTMFAEGLLSRGGDLPDTNQARKRMGVFAKGTSKAGENVRVVAREGDRNLVHYPYNPNYNENMGRLNRLRGTGEAAQLAAKNVTKSKGKTVKIKSGGAGGVEEK